MSSFLDAGFLASYIYEHDEIRRRIASGDGVIVKSSGDNFNVTIVGPNFRVEKSVLRDALEDDGSRTAFGTAYGRAKRFRADLAREVKAACPKPLTPIN